MLLAVGVSIWLISDKMGLGLVELSHTIRESQYSQVFFWEGKQHFLKQFLSGAFLAIVMTGLDQDMMQKNLSCRSLSDAKKNMYSFSVVLIVVNIFFLALGAMLYLYAEQIGMGITKGDDLFPLVALKADLGLGVGIFFILGLIAAAYSSADSALTSLTTSFCVDFMNIEQKAERQQIQTRKWVHVGFSVVLVLAILIFRAINDDSVISALFKVAGYTYGPLLGLFAFGIFTKWNIKDRAVPIVAVLSPVIAYVLQLYIPFGFELLMVNGGITFLGLCLLIKRA
jgi:Na+/proline symporter